MSQLGSVIAGTLMSGAPGDGFYTEHGGVTKLTAMCLSTAGEPVTYQRVPVD